MTRSPSLRSLFLSTGYRIHERNLEWCECWIERERESWFGRGLTPEAAFSEAAKQALPSDLARDLADRAAIDAPAALSGLPTPPTPPVKLVVPEPAPEPPAADAALLELEMLSERINGHREELGLCPAHRQRAVILAWICEARAQVEAFPDHEGVREGVGRVSRQLSEMGRAYWPGSVTALQLHMTPEELPSGVLGGHASSWARAAELATESLIRQELTEQGPSYDEYGWQDGPALSLVPSEPAKMMEALVEDVESIGGSLQRVASHGQTPPTPERFAGWVRQLRALRASEDEAADWGRVAGRLRWWASRRLPELAPIARELEPHYRPTGNWVDYFPDLKVQPIGPQPWQQCRMLSDLRSFYKDKRILMVNGSRDPGRESGLRQALGGPPIEGVVLEKERMKEAERRIRAGDYDLVLASFGFQTGWADTRLSVACREAGVKYLRVYRGRVWSCLRVASRVEAPDATMQA